jgi:hypothetical protein
MSKVYDMDTKSLVNRVENGLRQGIPRGVVCGTMRYFFESGVSSSEEGLGSTLGPLVEYAVEEIKDVLWDAFLKGLQVYCLHPDEQVCSELSNERDVKMILTHNRPLPFVLQIRELTDDVYTARLVFILVVEPIEALCSTR